MPVVKSGQTSVMIRSAVVLDMRDVEEQARQVLAEAQAQARASIEQAQQRAAHLNAEADERGHEEGFQRGVREGREQGMREGTEQALLEWRDRLATIAERWAAAIEEWELQREYMFDAAREDVLKFAFALAERIVHRMVRADANIVADQLRLALERLSKPTLVQVSIHPEDRPVIERVLPEVCTSLSAAAHIRLHDDPTLERGGCAVATAGGYVDASLSTQLDRLAETLLREGRLIERPPMEMNDS